MNDWRDDLNRLTVEFHYGVGDLSEVASWAAVANAETGEVHPLVWDIFMTPASSAMTSLLTQMAWDISKFRPDSQEALPFAIDSLRKALTQFFARERTVQSLCELVSDLDTIHVLGLPNDDRPAGTPVNEVPAFFWLGNLWNCCDWCDASWTYENSQSLVDEARRVLERLDNDRFRVHRMSAVSL